MNIPEMFFVWCIKQMFSEYLFIDHIQNSVGNVVLIQGYF